MSSDAEYEVADGYAGNEQLEEEEQLEEDEGFDVKAEHELGDLVDDDSEDDIEAPELSVDGDDDEQMQQQMQTFKQDPDENEEGLFDDQEEDDEIPNYRGQSGAHQQADEENMIGLESSNVSQMGEDDDEEEEETGGQEDDEEEEAETLPVVTEDDVDENGVYKWKEFQGAVVRQFTPEQYALLQEPFNRGWKRELVIRMSASTREKKAGDVYYYPADGTQKLRSYVELNGYIKVNPNLGLTKEHFTYSKQPVWRPPDEIVRPALARGCNYVHRPMYFQKATNQVKPNRGGGRGGVGSGGLTRSSTGGGSGGSPPKKSPAGHGQGGHAGGFGRGKRKRVLPSRYDDDSFDLLTGSKRSRSQGGSLSGLKESFSNGNSQDASPSGSVKNASVITSHHLSASKLERRLNLQKQLLQQVHEENLKKQKALEEAGKLIQERNNAQLAELKKEEDSGATLGAGGKPLAPLKIKIPKQRRSQLEQHLLGGKATKFSKGGASMIQQQTAANGHGEDACDAGRSLLHHPGAEDEEEASGVGLVPGGTRQPCSAHCPGKRNQLPNLMCSRCFCLFHLGCVPDGIWLENPNRFICPNCVTAEDRLIVSGAAAATSVALEKSPPRVVQPKSAAANHNHHHHHHHHHPSAYSPPTGPGVAAGAGAGLTGGIFTTATLTDADPLELHQMSPSMSITKTIPSIPLKNQPQSMIHSMKNSGGFGANANSLLKTANGFGGAGGQQFMNGGNKKFPKRMFNSTGIVPQGGGASRMNGGQMLNPKMHQQFANNKMNGGGGMYHQGMATGNKKGKAPFSGGPYGLSAKQAAQMSLQPSINHVYRMTQANNGHSVVLKERTIPYGTTIAPIPGNGAGNRPSSYAHLGGMSPSSNQKSAGASNRRFSGNHPSLPNGGGEKSSFEEKLNAIMAMTEVAGGGLKRPKGPSKYAKYLAKSGSVLNSFAGSLKGLMKILDYLDTRDIIALRQANTFWYRITTMTPLWTRLCFRGLPILDWSHLSTKIIGPNLVTVLDFEGVKVPNLSSPEAGTRAEKLNSFWKNFEQLHHHLGSVEVMKFGTLPLFVLQELSGLTKEGQPFEPFRKLKVLSVSNVVSSGDTEAPVTLEEIFPLIEMFSGVEVLKIAAKSGLVMSRDEEVVTEEAAGDEPKPKRKTREEILDCIASTLGQFENLTSLSLPSLSGLSATEYSSLLVALKYDQLKTLELGSAENWCRKSEDDSEEEEWSSPMELLAKCGEVTSLKLVEVKVDEHAALVAGLFENVILVEKLSFEKLTVEDSGFGPWTTLTALFKSLPLSELHFTTDDPFTNRALFESARDLVSTQRRPLSITWTVTVNVDDQGHAFVPLSLGTFTATPNLDFVKRYLSVLETPTELYQVEEQSVAVEIETLSELMNRDINLNAWSGGGEPMVNVAIVPQ